ncbi:hypothetical protein AB0F88_17170 [Streptosporangium sp. NPDC023963]|uniref:hypothetical protein n=1 Tax=Streptosporangium sp. NPDC023963 TaxID=3155608 RepID=UPI003433DCAC
MSFPTGASTASFTLALDCGHTAEHTVWEGVTPQQQGWLPGVNRWCACCARNRTVTAVHTAAPAA